MVCSHRRSKLVIWWFTLEKQEFKSWLLKIKSHINHPLIFDLTNTKKPAIRSLAPSQIPKAYWQYFGLDPLTMKVSFPWRKQFPSLKCYHEDLSLELCTDDAIWDDFVFASEQGSVFVKSCVLNEIGDTRHKYLIRRPEDLCCHFVFSMEKLFSLFPFVTIKA